MAQLLSLMRRGQTLGTAAGSDASSFDPAGAATSAYNNSLQALAALNSSQWEGATSTLYANSAYWQSVYSTTQNNSSDWKMIWHEISGNTSAIVNNGYIICTSSNAVTLTLPSSPILGSLVSLRVDSLINTVTVDRNNSLIDSLAEDLQVNMPNAGFTLVFSNLNGWVFADDIPEVDSPAEPSGTVALHDALSTAHSAAFLVARDYFYYRDHITNLIWRQWIENGEMYKEVMP